MYICIKDYKGYFKKGDKVVLKDGKYIIDNDDDIIIDIPTKLLNDEKYFKKSIDVKSEEGGLDSNIEKEFKIVINVKCTEKKLLDYKKAIYDSINDV